MTYLDNAGRKGSSTDQPLWDYLFDIHPKTRSQYEFQKFIAGISSQYGSYMVGKSQTEKGSKTMDLYSIDFSDITYPWLSGLSGGNEYSAVGSAGWQFSHNVSSLYKTAVRKSTGKKKSGYGRRYHYRHRGW